MSWSIYTKPIALFLLPIGGIWPIVDIVRRKEKKRRKEIRNKTKPLFVYWPCNVK
jgi:hypothetical protein